MGMLESAVYFPSLMMVTENFAFMAGSSKHGKASRANVGSNNVAAKYLEKKSREAKQNNLKITSAACAFYKFTGFNTPAQAVLWTKQLESNAPRPHYARENLFRYILTVGLPSTLIRRENGAFGKLSLNQSNLKTPGLRFSVDRNPFKVT